MGNDDSERIEDALNGKVSFETAQCFNTTLSLLHSLRAQREREGEGGRRGGRGDKRRKRRGVLSIPSIAEIIDISSDVDSPADAFTTASSSLQCRLCSRLQCA